ncbi:MAG: hypothetical protein ABI963_00455 [Rhizomicrobium sp.]
MTALDSIGQAPEVRQPRVLSLLLGMCAAPLAWLGHMMLGYAVTAAICYPGDHPVSLTSGGPLFAALVAFDLLALAICAAGAFVSWRGWNRLRAGEGSNRFLALGGLMFGLWFFTAILFNVIASVMVPPCVG